MKMIPILFSPQMVCAILNGTKTQTRRVIKPQPPEIVTSAGSYANNTEGQTDRWSWLSGDPKDCDTWGFEGEFKTEYRPGDQLWVRETWRTTPAYDDLAPCELDVDVPLNYLADDSYFNWAEADGSRYGKTRVSIHMPAWAARIHLGIISVRVERLQDISRGDATAEGCPFPNMQSGPNPKDWFRDLWNGINGKREGASWDANPWVVAVEFEKIGK